MELRKTEQKVDELISLYASLRASSSSSSICDKTLQEIPPRVNIDAKPTEQGTEKSQESQESEMDCTTSPSDLAALDKLSSFVTGLEKLQSEILELQPKLDRFHQRLKETDPVTGNPRYGERTQVRVQNLCDAYDSLQYALLPQTKTEDSTTSNTNKEQQQESEVDGEPSLPWMILNQLRDRLDEEKTLTEQERREKEVARQKERERLAKEQEKARLLAEQKRKREEELQAQQEAEALADLRRRADEARRQRQAEQEAERAWIASIPVGREGVEGAVRQLKASTAIDLDSQRTALSSLLRIFQQINAHPEETKFRRIRRDHAKFNQDIGRHNGGREVLIAAGFELGAIDDTPCFLSKEPDIENDMDGWSAWFDLLKATLEVLEKEQV